MHNTIYAQPTLNTLERHLKPQHIEQLLIRGCSLLANDQPGQLLRDQDILIAGQHIVAIGPTGTLDQYSPTVDRLIEARGQLAIPGLINAHTHSLENLLKASSPSLPLELWLIPLFAATFQWSPHLVYLSALAGALEMLKSGTTSVLDHLWTDVGLNAEYLDATMRAYRDAGIRASVAPSIEDQDLVLEAGAQHGITFPHHPFTDRFTDWPPIHEQLATLEQFIATWHNTEQGRLQCIVGPSGIHWCSPELLASCRDIATNYNTGLHLHAVETELQAKIIQQFHHQGGINYLDQMGILKPGTSLAHAIWLEPGDLELLARTQTTLVHNPTSNLRLGSGHFPLIKALQSHVSIALGSDGSASNDTQNMFGVLKLTGLIHNQSTIDYKTWPQATEILHTATQGGAAALGHSSDLGQIAPGQLADIVLLDIESAAFLPLRNPYLHLVYCEQGASVDTVIVNGEIVIKQGVVTTVDEQALRREILEQCSFSCSNSPENLASINNTREVLNAIDTLRQIILHKGHEV